MTTILTLIAAPGSADLSAARVARARDAARAGAPDWLSSNEAVDLPCAAPPDMGQVRAALDGARVDAVAIPAQGRRKRLLIADMDSTIVTGETLDELAAHAGVGDAVAAITARSMAGELDFAAALRARVGMLHGLGLEALDRTWQGVRLTAGAKQLVATMRAHGAFTALVSGGFTFFTARVAAQCGFDAHRANVLLDDGTSLLGTVSEPILDRDAKLAALLELAAARGLGLAKTLAVGDGANDLAMLGAAGLGVAFHAKPVMASVAQARLDHADLRGLLFIQGYRAGEFAGS